MTSLVSPSRHLLAELREAYLEQRRRIPLRVLAHYARRLDLRPSELRRWLVETTQREPDVDTDPTGMPPQMREVR